MPLLVGQEFGLPEEGLGQHGEPQPPAGFDAAACHGQRLVKLARVTADEQSERQLDSGSRGQCADTQRSAASLYQTVDAAPTERVEAAEVVEGSDPP